MIVLVHGGAANVGEVVISAKLVGVKEAVRAGYNALLNGQSAMDAVEESVIVLENNPNMNCGYGSSLTTAGTVECDAVIMDGKDLKAGAVACVKHIKNPVSLARAVMKGTPHCLLVSTGAEKFAEEVGFKLVANETLIHECAQERLKNNLNFEKTISEDKPKTRAKGVNRQSGEHDTVGAVAIDSLGNCAFATSTGGLTGQRVGRVGDSPILGAGGYADNTTGAVSTTGHGEAIMRVCLARHILWEKSGRSPKSLQQSVDDSLDMMANRVDGYGGAIAVSTDGQIGVGFSTGMMAWAYIDSTDSEKQIHYGIRKGEHLTEKL